MFMARKIYPSYNDYFSLFTTIMKDPTYSPAPLFLLGILAQN